MATSNLIDEELDPMEDQENWGIFCSRKCQIFSSDFVKSWSCFCSSKSLAIERQTVIGKIVEILPSLLNKAFETHPENSSVAPVSPTAILPSSSNAFDIGAQDINSELTLSDDSFESPMLKLPSSQFFKRFSFKSLRKARGFFIKQHSDEVELSPRKSKPTFKDYDRTRTVKLTFECVKEGNVKLMLGDDSHGQLEWMKCRMVLFKMGAGYAVEFWSTKNMKSTNGVFCNDITEVRTTTEMEMPELRNTFVIKAERGVELVIEAKDFDDMKLWMTSIVSVSSSNDDENTFQNLAQENDAFERSGRSDAPDLPARGRRTTLADLPVLPDRRSKPEGRSDRANMFFDLRGNHAFIEDLIDGRVPRPTIEPRQPRPTIIEDPTRGPFTTRAALEAALEAQGAVGGEDISGTDHRSQLAMYPWFHGMQKRAEATELIQQGGSEGNGNFLIRQSETRQGEYVLTFNSEGKAKHVRMTVHRNGSCRMQVMSFLSVFDLLEYFKKNKIYLESGGISDVMLNEFIICENRLGNPSQIVTSGEQRRAVTPPINREHRTYGGSVRLTSAMLEDENNEDNNSSGRAVENTYTFT